ncbi:biosynthetic arginine decarboxylase [Legionella oakridgensis]|uniref:Arginine decarboxylase n=2 Tax=Legionella oakridgensis TaxID=29423 RepID=W0BGP3_9GAMM|nr:biosynthetic arginine decarboxylase [Legionella oakridgensis]AHE67762.1 arginine decarboxylase, biosynthetic [Legionella oakridgensis ATCC 33761 = DSM 21215]KTD36911.1 arginine decarboxylase [Legionella oakridgensis]STY20780.1 arginine decarboxylase [Legionella longbeachae]
MNQNAISDENLYNISNWGEGYFTINPQGNMEICKHVSEQGVELQTIVHAASRAGLHLPLLIRFTDILHDRVVKLYEAFSQAIEETNYHGSYQLVYPIKVNQEQCVVRELLKAPNHPIGLEAGSKPELMAVLGLLGEHSSTIICNGYKDRDYIRIALIAQQIGHSVFIVIEKLSELDVILREAERLQMKPRIGVRIRLVTKGAGKWENTAGAKSKFGLNAEQVLDLIHQLKTHNALECLQLMHCHLGSQIANIRDIRSCMLEVARYYVELRRLQAPINTIDVGGGLGVDYEGTRSNTGCSMNYSLHEYATNILLAVRDLCHEAQMPEPNIISESGRALTAHHAVLVTNITGVEMIKSSSALPTIEDSESRIIHDIWDTYQAIPDSSPTEIYHYAAHALDEANSMFKHGVISLTEKAKVEQLYHAICLEIQQRLDENNPGDGELIDLINERLATKVFCNVSFFQSLPDAWAIGQIFPVAPITQLSDKPSMHCILQDLTCDSDGTLKQYTGSSCINTTLLLPPYHANKPYVLGFFLVGAYQEILGNLHNLFGDTNSLDVKLTGAGTFEINDLVSGDTVTNVLNFAHFDSKKLLQSYEKQLIKSDLPDETVQTYLNELRSIFTQLTYLDSK